jgi:hypothetical protein
VAAGRNGGARAVSDQAGALDVTAHGAQVPMAGMAHNVFVAHALVVGFGPARVQFIGLLSMLRAKVSPWLDALRAP